MEFIDNGQRVTRKSHQCAYCAILIPTKTMVNWWTYVDGGRIATSYGHIECTKADHWDALQNGRFFDEELLDPGEFVREVLEPYRSYARSS